MAKRTLLNLARLVLVVTALAWGVGQAGAQAQSANSPQTAPNRSTKKVMKMRQITNAQRMAAATRNADRRAAALRKNGVVPGSQSGVKQ